MSIRFLKLSLASPESIRSWTERILPNGKRVGKILKGDLIDYKNGLPIRDGLSCERIFGPMVSFTCTCGRFKCIETRGIHIVHDTLRSSRPILPDVSRQNSGLTVKQWGEEESSLQTSSKVKIDNRVTSGVSKNLMDKSIKKLINNQKPSHKLKSVKSMESSILQPITYKQKKMLRFLSDFYYDYQSTYHSNKTETIPSFVSVFEEPSNMILAEQKSVAKNFFKQQTVQYHSKKKQISKFLKHPGFLFKKIWSQPYLEYEYLFYPIVNKQTVGLKIHSSLIQNLFKPLSKFIFQIYTKFWFDLKIHSNDFIYEKHFFSWVSHARKTQKMYDNFKVHPSFFRKFRIIGLYNKSQELPIIGRFLSFQTKTSNRLKRARDLPIFVNLLDKDTIKPVISSQTTETWDETQINYCNISNSNLLNFRHGGNLNNLNYKYLDFLNLPEFLLILKQWPKNFFIKIILSSIFLLQKRNPFFLANIETKKFPNNWYKVSLLQDRFYMDFLFKDCRFNYFKPENFLGFQSMRSPILSINNLQKKHIAFSDKKNNHQTSDRLKSAKDLGSEVKPQAEPNFKLVQSYNSQIWRSFTPNSASWSIIY